MQSFRGGTYANKIVGVGSVSALCYHAGDIKALEVIDVEGESSERYVEGGDPKKGGWDVALTDTFFSIEVILAR